MTFLLYIAEYGFKMWPIHNEKVAFERFLSWPNCGFAAIWNAISAIERFLHIMTKNAIETETAF